MAAPLRRLERAPESPAHALRALPELPPFVQPSTARAVQELLNDPNPPPERLRSFLGALARHAHDALTGARQSLPFETCLTPEVVAHLRDRMNHRSFALAPHTPPPRDTSYETTVHIQQLMPHCRDAVVLVRNSDICRAVSLRLQWQQRRWRVTELWVL